MLARLLLLAVVVFTLVVAISTKFAIDDHRKGEALIRAASVRFQNRHLSVTGTTLAPAHVVLFLDDVPVAEQVTGPRPNENNARLISGDHLHACADWTCAFRLTVPAQVPTTVLGLPIALTAEASGHPRWGTSVKSLPYTGRAVDDPHRKTSPASSAESRLVSRTTHVWVSPHYLRYAAVIQLPTDATLLRALLVGLAQKTFLMKALAITVDGKSLGAADMNPRMQVSAGGRRALVIVNGATSDSSFGQNNQLRIAENTSPWLSYQSVADKRNETLAVTVRGFTIRSYGMLDSATLDSQMPYKLSQDGTAVWYGSLSRDYNYRLALSRNLPKTLTDIRRILRETAPPVWSVEYIPVGVGQVLILVALILGLFLVVRSGNETAAVLSLVGLLAADTCINLLVRVSFQLVRSPIMGPALIGGGVGTHWLAYLIIFACIVGAVIWLGTRMFAYLGVRGARGPFAFTIICACSIVVIATYLTFNQPSLLDFGAAHQLGLRGACSILAFALFLIQFRPDVFATVLSRRNATRIGLVTAVSLFLAVCAWFTSPVIPPDGLSRPMGAYIPLAIVADASYGARNLAPLLFATTILLPGLLCVTTPRWQGREWQLALFLVILCVGYNYVFVGIPIGLIFSLVAIRFLVLRSEQMAVLDTAVAGRDAQTIVPSDITTLLDIRRATLAQSSVKDSFLNGQMPGAEYESRTADLEAYANTARQTLGPAASYESLVLGYHFGPGQSLLENGRLGALFGLFAGIAAVLLHLQDVLATFSDSHMVVFDSIAVLALAIFRPIPAGFALGFTLAYLRGNMASTKGVFLALALCAGLIPYAFFQYTSHEALSEGLHLLLLFGSIGLAMDVLTAIRLARTLPIRQLLGLTGVVNVTATAAVAASIFVSLITQETRSLLNVAMQNATVALHTAMTNVPGQLGQ